LKSPEYLAANLTLIPSASIFFVISTAFSLAQIMMPIFWPVSIFSPSSFPLL
jgi:hypothetical protein